MESDPSTPLISSILIVVGLIVTGGLFVAAEIALISLRESQVKQLALRGKRGAIVAKLAANPNRLLGALQVGVTLTGFLSAALGAEKLGVYGHSTGWKILACRKNLPLPLHSSASPWLLLTSHLYSVSSFQNAWHYFALSRLRSPLPYLLTL